MHKLVVPHKCSTHRFTTLALYRALLRQCAKLPEDLPERNAPKDHIQLRFHRYKKLQSPSQVAHTLKAGYDALDLLHAISQGNHEKTEYLRTLLSETTLNRERKSAVQRELARLKPVKPPSTLDLRKQANKEFQRKTAVRHPDAESVLARPRPVVNGIRRVPKLVSARGIPMLRFKKPQPAIVGRVIRAKHRKRDKSLLERDFLMQEILWAKDEDQWDHLTGQAEAGCVPWRHAFDLSLSKNKERIAEMDQKDHDLTVAMWNIVLKERKLAAKEAQERADKASASQEESSDENKNRGGSAI
ncbi:LYR motif-containing protein [Aspergillus saccharolyticus JOP 1030-1]|uniref:Complex 1 LYR protein domain-containing protein n=1 Tax=Aspergillus saccharolyticus JOP 1030-1 TaxID=1450539 RepID=A0A318ZPT5_9EURO|nr:hypothetical protein BP01DRAFT_359747 [Aspergillus saccharolyticus JOP 1030-1]PYH42128.1 hypothetical protein BP01DRAFT_359747 [Aspergillus saccharolyticus JOP 1030-1]